MAFEFNQVYDEENSVINIDMIGELDIYAAQEFKNGVLDFYNKNKNDIDINCENLSYIDSTGLGSMIAILKEVKEDGNNIYISNIKNNIRKLFKITKLDELFKFRGEENVQ
ncbi:MAG: STAS domain-containing protein [Tissierellia bacterium]|nr:STAS domain-containing protein [Tissierellia bacterium]